MEHTDPEADMVNTDSGKSLQLLNWIIIHVLLGRFPKYKIKRHHDGRKLGKLPASLTYRSNSNKYTLLLNTLGDSTQPIILVNYH